MAVVGEERETGSHEVADLWYIRQQTEPAVYIEGESRGEEELNNR